MGYRGLPSKACSNCRARRIKCSLSHPCSQCLRAGRPCDGARPIMDLMFRDQTEEITCKAQGVKQKPKPKSTAATNDAASDCSQVSRRSMDSDVSADSGRLSVRWNTMQVPVEQQAVSFFFSNYVLEPSNQNKTMYDYLPTFYNNVSEKSALSCAVAALGLAGLSYRRSEACLLSAAKVMYSSALHLTNEALRDPTTAATDATLVSVLLLGLYETNTGYALVSMRSWLKHIRGATVLLELRGKKQLDTEIGRRLFAHVRTQIVNFCLVRRMPMPLAILELSGVHPAIGSDDSQADPVTRITAINAKICSLRARIGSFPLSTSAESPESIIFEALSIAADLNEWHASLPHDYFPSSTIKIQSPTPEVYSDYYHIYRDRWTAGLMNHYRVILILVHEIILIQLNYIRHPSPDELNAEAGYNPISLPSYAAQITKSSQKITLDLIDLICASVPFHLDYEYYARPEGIHTEYPPPRAAGGNALMWALYVCAQIYFVHNSTRAWIIGRLNKIGSEMGVQQANTLAKFLLQRKEITNVVVQDDDRYDKDV